MKGVAAECYLMGGWGQTVRGDHGRYHTGSGSLPGLARTELTSRL